jgi:trk system potassium uptake protein TrkH
MRNWKNSSAPSNSREPVFMSGGFGTVAHLVAFIVCLTGLAMIPSLAIAAAFGERDMILPFAASAGLALAAGLPFVILGRKTRPRFTPSRGLLIVCLAWVSACLLGSLPYLASRALPGVSGAVFESVSGFTTTGATLFIEPEALPRSLLFWRAMTHWLGGMGLIVLTVALVPLLGTGAFTLNGSSIFQAETTGPEDDKITPRITGTAKIFLLLYLGLSLLCTLFFLLGGMGWFDALTHAFSTIATGGFGSRAASIAAFTGPEYNAPWIEWTCIVFMFLAGYNFNLIYRLIRGRFRDAFSNSEGRAYTGIVLAAAFLCFVSVFPLYKTSGEGIRKSFFHVISILTTTGFSSADMTAWPPLAQGVIFFVSFIGGCSSSTAGGVKVVRYVILAKQTKNEIKKLLWPRGVFSISLNKKEGRKDVIYSVAGFVFLYASMVLAGALLLCSQNLDFFSSFNLSLLCAGDIGLGLVSGRMEKILLDLPWFVKWALSFIMIAGRLELWTVFALFSREYRRS